MRSQFLLPLVVLALIGCQGKKADLPSTPGAVPQSDQARPPVSAAAPKTDPAALAAEVAGAIKGKPFKPDQVTIEGNKLTFRKGKDFFADMEIAFDLPKSDGSREGKAWSFGGDNFGDPTITVQAREGQGAPDSDFVWAKDYTMSLKIAKQTPKAIEGTIDLKIAKPANTHLIGTFSARVNKTATDPLDAEDAPYVEGKIAIIGQWQEEMLSAGFHGKGTDGKRYSNGAGTKLSPGSGGSATCTTFKPQLTSITNDVTRGLCYRHVKMAPGDYLVSVRRGDVMAAWKKVTVKPGDQLTVDLTIDLAKMGSIVATLPDAEANDSSEWRLSLIPIELDSPALGDPFQFGGAEVKKGTKTVTVKGVPAGKYRARRGKSEAEVEVTAGKEAAVTLIRKESKR
jgi:hypothetical protein